MTDYELFGNVLRIFPYILILSLSLLLSGKSRFLRLPVVFICGYIAIVVFTQLFWDYSIHHAPTHEIRVALAKKDSGPRVGAIFFGWIHVVISMAIIESIMSVTRAVKRRLCKAKKQDNKDQDEAEANDLSS